MTRAYVPQPPRRYLEVAPENLAAVRTMASVCGETDLASGNVLVEVRDVTVRQAALDLAEKWREYEAALLEEDWWPPPEE